MRTYELAGGFGSSGDQGTAELLAGHPSGFVSRWTSKKGWVHVEGSEFGGDNGVAQNFWLSSFRGDRILRVKSNPDP